MNQKDLPIWLCAYICLIIFAAVAITYIGTYLEKYSTIIYVILFMIIVEVASIFGPKIKK